MPVTKPARKKPVSAATLEKAVTPILTDILVAVLKTATLRKRAGISLKGVHEVSLGCEVNFLSSAQMKKVNAKFRGKNKDTDVLSFPAPEVFRKQGMLGEILISPSVLFDQASEHGHPWRAELAVLLTHGVLHLLDFDHERGVKDAKQMAKWEKLLLTPEKETKGLISRSKPQ